MDVTTLVVIVAALLVLAVPIVCLTALVARFSLRIGEELTESRRTLALMATKDADTRTDLLGQTKMETDWSPNAAAAQAISYDEMSEAAREGLTMVERQQ